MNTTSVRLHLTPAGEEAWDVLVNGNLWVSVCYERMARAIAAKMVNDPRGKVITFYEPEWLEKGEA